ncbi:MAG TPA: hypothetical protein VGY56_19970 [Verrucomicrobiae bacterium]|nr:hypothetical protein [Verrucomicrobiae bacterium]
MRQVQLKSWRKKRNKRLAALMMAVNSVTAMQTEMIKLCCAKCDFAVEEYTPAQLAEIPRKAKRYKYLPGNAIVF